MVVISVLKVTGRKSVLPHLGVTETQKFSVAKVWFLSLACDEEIKIGEF
jgi:hypothetical protein